MSLWKKLLHRRIIKKNTTSNTPLPGSDAGAAHICKGCRQIDFQEVFDLSAAELRDAADAGILIARIPRRRLAAPKVERTDCAMCRTFHQSRRTWRDENNFFKAWRQGRFYELRVYSLLQVHTNLHDIIVPRMVIPRDCPVMAVRLPGDLPVSHFNAISYLFCQKGAQESGQMAIFQPLKCQADLSVIGEWLNYCASNHANICCSIERQVEGLKVIDCVSRTVVTAPAECHYAALSYVWGNVKMPVLLEGVGLPRELPRTIADAVAVCRFLGFYLWVDSLCIDQGNSTEVHDQVEKMGNIYQGASFTIISTAGKDADAGLPGVNNTERTAVPGAMVRDVHVFSTGHNQRHEIENSIWRQRGWTFQEEIFSRRRVIFTKEKIFFECHGMRSHECLRFGPDLIPTDSIGGRVLKDSRLDAPGIDCAWDSLQNYLKYVEDYSGRHLTFDADALRAFAGVMNHFAAARYPISQVWGMPFLKSCEAGDVLHAFLAGFAWYHPEPGFYNPYNDPTFRRADIPSWTWAGWKGGRQHWRSTSASKKDLEFATSKLWFEHEAHRLETHQSFFARASSTPADIQYPKAVVLECSVVYPESVVKSGEFEYNINDLYYASFYLSKRGILDQLPILFKRKQLYLLIICCEYEPDHMDGKAYGFVGSKLPKLNSHFYMWVLAYMMVVEKVGDSVSRVGLMVCSWYGARDFASFQKKIGAVREKVRLI
ncbi:HET-domain-containing protein [Lophium mytilinum]|uniref:HET-domain-containing protein n=1 Tax=Lophium mytilinum TaxID=390894 RepID=A0A6A6R6I7_9PEZI|nr:HET-domain-containing protein [Lophium mytilinum]